MELQNLDAMHRSDVVEFAVAIGNGVRPIRAAREIFPERPKGYVRATVDLRNYAWNKATAMRCREAGKIQTALMYEYICDRIYSECLPEWARW